MSSDSKHNEPKDERKTLRGRILRWGPVGFWMGVIFYLSAQPTLPEVPVIGSIEWGDKIAHALAYSVGAALIWRALSRKGPKWWQICATIALATAYGLSDESHQLLVPPRTFDTFDLGADIVGSAISAIILTLSMGGSKVGTRTRGREDSRSQRQETD